MRLLYLLVDETDPAPERVALRRTQGQQMVPAGWTFQVDSIRIGPEFYEENAVGHLLAGPGILHAVLRHQDDSDAVIIACFSDPALAAARAVSRLPVVGPGEASLLLAQLTARTFGVITILDSTVPQVEESVAALGLAGRCVGIEVMAMTVSGISGDTAAATATLVETGRRLADRGAQAIVLGCMSFGFGPFAAVAEQELGVPVINPLRASIAALQATQTLGTRLGPPAPVLERPDSLHRFLHRLERDVAPV